jgi:hypothetical protein
MVWRARSASICLLPYLNVDCISLKNIVSLAMTTFVVAFKSLNSGCSRKSSRCGRIHSYAGPRRYDVRNKSFLRLVLSFSAFKVRYVKH